MVIGYDELPRIAEFLGTDEVGLVHDLNLVPEFDGWWLDVGGAPCPMLRDDRCTIHEVKPRQCATYPFWPEIVESARSWQNEQRSCPGIGRGEPWPPEKVRAFLAELDPDLG